MNMQPRHFDDLLQPLQQRTEELLAEELTNSQGYSGDWNEVQLAATVERVVGSLFSQLLFGPALCKASEFTESVHNFMEDMMRFLRLYPLSPESFAATLYQILTKGGRSTHALLRKLEPITSGVPGSWTESDRNKKHSALGLLMEATAELDAEYWTPQRISRTMLGLCVGSLHSPWTNMYFLLFELARRPDDIEDLRREIRGNKKLDWKTLDRLPFLNSFIKESLRYTPPDKRE